MIDVGKRGFFGVGIENTKIEQNVGTLWRSAYNLGASFIFTIGRRYSHQASDTVKTFKNIPLYHYESVNDMFIHLPYSCPLIGVELVPRSKNIVNYVHPESCIYLLGAEDNGLTTVALNACHEIIQIPSDLCMNVSVAGSIIMYDRMSKNIK